MKCYASDYCQKDKSSCSDVCGGYRVLRALYNLSRIPERYRYTIALKPENGEDLEAFTTLDNYKNDVLSMVELKAAEVVQLVLEVLQLKLETNIKAGQ